MKLTNIMAKGSKNYQSLFPDYSENILKADYAKYPMLCVTCFFDWQGSAEALGGYVGAIFPRCEN